MTNKAYLKLKYLRYNLIVIIPYKYIFNLLQVMITVIQQIISND